MNAIKAGHEDGVRRILEDKQIRSDAIGVTYFIIDVHDKDPKVRLEGKVELSHQPEQDGTETLVFEWHVRGDRDRILSLYKSCVSLLIEQKIEHANVSFTLLPVVLGDSLEAQDSKP